MTGLRKGELLGLRWQDVDLEGGVLYVRQALQRLGSEGITFRAPKTRGSGRAVALSPATVRRLRQHRQRQLAARICAHAEPGEILAPIVVRELAAGKGFLFSDRGELALRGFEDPVRLHEVRWGG